MADDPKSCINFKFLQKSSSHPRNAFSSNSPIRLNKISYFCLLVSSLIWSNAQMCSSYILLASRLHTLMMYCRLCFEILWLQLLHATFERLLWQKLGGRTSVSLQLLQLMKRLWSQTSRYSKYLKLTTRSTAFRINMTFYRQKLTIGPGS